MTAHDISRISQAITEAVKPYVKGLVDDAVREIPYTIRKELDSIVATELRGIIRKTVQDRVMVDVELRHGTDEWCDVFSPKPSPSPERLRILRLVQKMIDEAMNDLHRSLYVP